jgi:hypothetical protein
VPDSGFDALYASRDPGEALHFIVAGEDAVARFVFVLFERFFGQGLWVGESLVVTQRPPDGAEAAAIAIWIRPEDTEQGAARAATQARAD